jgi:hypothetical protein
MFKEKNIVFTTPPSFLEAWRGCGGVVGKAFTKSQS